MSRRPIRKKPGAELVVPLDPELGAELDRHLNRLMRSAPGGAWSKTTAAINLMWVGLQTQRDHEPPVRVGAETRILDGDRACAAVTTMFEELVGPDVKIMADGARDPLLVYQSPPSGGRVYVAALERKEPGPGSSRVYIFLRLRVSPRKGKNISAHLGPTLVDKLTGELPPPPSALRGNGRLELWSGRARSGARRD